MASTFLSTPSARRATSAVPVWTPIQQISIHALREEGDGLLIAPTRCLCNFYPRPPRGGRLSLADEIAAAYEFLSTPSARRATCGLCVAQGRRAISIHALREEGDTSSHLNYRRQKISIHALREEGDIVATFDGLRVYNFYPRPPRGGRRGRPRQLHDGADFYPRPPRGGRPLPYCTGRNFARFLSTPSARRATRPAFAWHSRW